MKKSRHSDSQTININNRGQLAVEHSEIGIVFLENNPVAGEKVLNFSQLLKFEI